MVFSLVVLLPETEGFKLSEGLMITAKAAVTPEDIVTKAKSYDGSKKYKDLCLKYAADVYEACGIKLENYKSAAVAASNLN